MDNNIIVVGFDQDSRAYQAFSVLKQAAADGRVVLEGAAVVERNAQGQLRVHDANTVLADLPSTTAGGLIGMLLGILGGPLGVLLGGTTGALIGSAGDIGDAAYGETVLAQMAELIPPGSTALIAAVGEVANDVIDGEMRRLGCVMARFAAIDVEAEIDAQEEAKRAAEREARRVLREQHAEERRQKFDAWKDHQRQNFDEFRNRVSASIEKSRAEDQAGFEQLQADANATAKRAGA